MKNRYIISVLLIFVACLNIHATDLTVKVGETKTLSFTDYVNFIPASYSWTTSSSHLIITSQNGNSCTVYGVSPTVADARVELTITGRTTKNVPTTRSKTFYIRVWDGKPDRIYLVPSILSLDIGSGSSLYVEAEPSGSSFSISSWTSSNTNVATVSNGAIIGVGRGQTRITAISDNGKSANCEVTVYDQPDNISLSGNTSIVIDETTLLTTTLLPDYSRSSITWTSNNTKVATVNESGLVTGHFGGSAEITARTANGKTASVIVNVREPDFTITSYHPMTDEKGVSVFNTPSLEFSLGVYPGSNYNSITLEGGGANVAGRLSVSGNMLSFMPTKALKELTDYTWNIPQGAIVNQWGTAYPTNISIKFRTGEYLPLTLTLSHPAGYVERGDAITVEPSNGNAVIHYTLDGSEPTTQSTRYTNGQTFIINEPIRLRVKAFLDGYKIPEVDAYYQITPLNISKKFPISEYPSNDLMYTYNDLNPYIEFDAEVSAGNGLNGCNVYCQTLKSYIEGSFIANGHRLVFVPKQPLPLGETFTMTIAEDAVRLASNAPNKYTTWNFTTGAFIKNISAGFTSASMIHSEPSSTMWIVGERVTDLEYFSKITSTWSETPSSFISSMAKTSNGMTHTLALGRNGTLYGFGLQFCGEISGENTLKNSLYQMARNVTLFSAGMQTSVYVSNGKLYAIGRSDSKQIIDDAEFSRVTEPVEITLPIAAANLIQVEAGDGNIFALANDGTLYGWGDNTYGQLLTKNRRATSKPQVVMNDVKSFALSKWNRGTIAVIKHDGSVWTWGNNERGQLGNGNTKSCAEPVKVMDNANSIAIGYHTMAAIDRDNQLWMWGYNGCGLYGDGTTNTSLVPKMVDHDVVDVGLGREYSLRLMTDGSVWQCGWRFRRDYVMYNRHEPWKIMSGRSQSPLQSLVMADESIHLFTGQQAVACALPSPLDANYTEWSWSTADETIATISERGVITAISEGTTKVTLTSDNGIRAQCQVVVSQATDIKDMSNESSCFDIYDLQGRKVRTKTVSTDGLPKGIYIINGKKIII